MFVPSLSWQNDRFYIKMEQKCRFSQAEGLKEQAQELLQECVRCAQELEEFGMVLN